jgi:transcriptional regulator GlxA family with amidase domain
VFALREFRVCRAVADVTDRIGLSPRRFIQVFADEVGLTPKLFCRVQRFQEVLGLVERRRRVDWVQVALDCGHYDQSHFIHDFRAFSGLNPTKYLRIRGDHRNHVPLTD